MTRPASRARWLSWPVIAVAVVGLTLSGFAARFVLDVQQTDDRERFEVRAERTRTSIRDRINSRSAVQEVLRDALTARWPTGRADFHELVRSADGDDPFAGVQAVSFDRLVRAEDRAAYEASVRSDTSLNGVGYPEFEVSPPSTEFDDLIVVDFIEPFEGNEAALGFDIGSDPARREAIERARDLGELIATEPVGLVQAGGDALGLLLISAVYDTPERLVSEPSRRRHFVGVVATVVRTDDLLAEVLDAQPTLEVEIYDQGPTVNRPLDQFGPDRLVFGDEDGRFVEPDGSVDGDHRRLDIDVGGRRWSLMARPTDQLQTSTLAPILTGAGGLTLTLALAALVGLVTGARSRAEELADRRTSDLRSLVASAPDATVVVDSNGSIVLASDQVARLLGHEPADLIGEPVEILVPESLRAHHVDHRDGFAKRPTVRMMGAALELEARHADGSTVPVEISLSPLPAHSLGSVVASLRDVSTQRKAFREVQRANEMQSAFLGTVSHELRTPLTAIDGFARLLASPDLELSDDQQHDFLQRIIRNSQGLAILIEELLEYSRLDRGTFGLEAVDGDLLEMTRHVVDQLGIVIESHTVVVDGTPTPVHVDPSAITRIVTNLLTNAVRYSPDGTRVSVTVEPSTDAGWAVLTVDDEGPGVRPTDRRLVFERFWRGEQTDQAGTGIGLAVVGDLCALAGGRAEVTDAQDGGARFVVTLPVRRDAGVNGTLVDGTLQRDV